MKHLKHRRLEKQKNSEEHILPLINVVFLLLIFFMIAGRLTPSDPFKIEPSKSISQTKENQDFPIIHIGNDGKLAFQNVEVSRADLNIKISEFLRQNPKGFPRLKVSGDYPAGKVLTLLSDLRAIGIEKVSLITELEANQ